MEFGPYNYQEYDLFSDLVWTNKMDNTTEVEVGTVLAILTNGLSFYS